MRIEIELEGARELEQQLDTLGQGVRNKVIRDALRQAVKLLETETKSRAPVRTGTLRRAIHTRVKMSKQQAEAYLSISEGHTERHDAFYWRYVEHGTRRAPAQPFIRPAFDRRRKDIIRLYENAILKVIRQL